MYSHTYTHSHKQTNKQTNKQQDALDAYVTGRQKQLDRSSINGRNPNKIRPASAGDQRRTDVRTDQMMHRIPTGVFMCVCVVSMCVACCVCLFVNLLGKGGILCICRVRKRVCACVREICCVVVVWVSCVYQSMCSCVYLYVCIERVCMYDVDILSCHF